MFQSMAIDAYIKIKKKSEKSFRQAEKNLLVKTACQIAAMKERQAKAFYEPDNNIVKSIWEENYYACYIITTIHCENGWEH